MDASDLDMELIGNLLELGHLGTELRQGNVDRSSQSSSEVGWARSDVAKMFIVGKLSHLLDLGSCFRKSCEDGTDVSTLLH